MAGSCRTILGKRARTEALASGWGVESTGLVLGPRGSVWFMYLWVSFETYSSPYLRVPMVNTGREE